MIELHCFTYVIYIYFRVTKLYWALLFYGLFSVIALHRYYVYLYFDHVDGKINETLNFNL